MSDLAALGMLLALGIANGFLFVVMDAWVKNRVDIIVTGGIRGMPLPIERRRYMLQVDVILNSGALIVIEGTLAIGWWLVGNNVDVAELKLLAYLVAFVDAVGAIGWLVTMPSHYRHIAGILRQAEAD